MSKTNLQYIKELEKELGERTIALIAHEPYKNINFVNGQLYNMIKGRIRTIEFRINFLERMEREKMARELAPIDMTVESDCFEYDSHLDTGMDTSIVIGNIYQNKELIN